MPTCEHSGAHVSDRYMRVSVPDDRERPRTCPHCPDVQSEGILNLNGNRSVEEVLSG